MATERLVIEIDERGARVVSRSIGAIGTSAARTESSVALLRRALGLIATGAIVRSLLRYADVFTRIQNQLRSTVTSSDQLATVTEELFGVAQRTGQSFEATVHVYDRIAAAQEDLGISQVRGVKLQEQFNQAIKLGGGTLEGSADSLSRFVTGLADGSLRGIELTRTLNQLPGVAQVIADHLDTTRGKLAGLADQGKITTATVIAAFDSQEEKLRTQADKLVPTLSGAFTKLNNALVVTVGELNQTTGATALLAGAIDEVTKLITGLRDETSGTSDVIRDVIVNALAILRTSARVVDLFTAGFKTALAVGRATGEQFRVIAEHLRRGRLPSLETLRQLDKDIVSAFTETITEAPVTSAVDELIDKYMNALGQQVVARKGELSDVAEGLVPRFQDFEVKFKPKLLERGEITGQRDLSKMITDLAEVAVLTNVISINNEKWITEFDELEGKWVPVRKLNEELTDLEVVGRTAFEGLFGAIDGLISGSIKSFEEFFSGIFLGIAQVTARLLLLKGLTAVGVPGSLLGLQHGGQFTVGGQGGPDSQLVAFKASPKERVTVETPGQQRGGDVNVPQPQLNAKIINVFDPRAMLDALSTAAGDRVVMNIIARNPAQIRRALGG